MTKTREPKTVEAFLGAGTPLNAWLIEKDACLPARSWARGKSPREAWEICQDAGWLLWAALAVGIDMRKVATAALMCAERAHHALTQRDLYTMARRRCLDMVGDAIRQTRRQSPAEFLSASLTLSAVLSCDFQTDGTPVQLATHAAQTLLELGEAVEGGKRLGEGRLRTVAWAVGNYSEEALSAASRAGWLRTPCTETLAQIVRSEIPWDVVMEKLPS